jgi:hypothetical protein
VEEEYYGTEETIRVLSKIYPHSNEEYIKSMISGGTLRAFKSHGDLLFRPIDIAHFLDYIKDNPDEQPNNPGPIVDEIHPDSFANLQPCETIETELNPDEMETGESWNPKKDIDPQL